MWMAAVLLGIFTVIGGLCISAWYLARVRPAIRDAENGRF
jgi:hypothetical protein